MPTTSDVRNAIKAVIEHELDDVDVSDVLVKPDADEYGAPVLMIDVVFEGRAGALDSSKTSTVRRHVLSTLRSLGEPGFPVLSFIAGVEFRGQAPETA